MTQRRRNTNPSPMRRNMRPRAGRYGSAIARAASIILPNGTPLGQAASHARHARHSSIIVMNDPSIAAPSSTTARIAAIRPRGEAVSRPVMRKVGQCGRHSPQATHRPMSASAGR